MKTGSIIVLITVETRYVLAFYRLSELPTFFFTLSFLHQYLQNPVRLININVSIFSETALTDLLLYGKLSFDKILFSENTSEIIFGLLFLI